MIQSQRNDLEPWYVKKKKAKQTRNQNNVRNLMSETLPKKSTRFFFLSFFRVIFLLLLTLFSGFFLALSITHLNQFSKFIILIGVSLLLMLSAIVFILYQLGSICSFFNEKYSGINVVALGFRFLKGDVEAEIPQRGIHAPEMALYQFIQQVRAYALEKSFAKQKSNEKPHYEGLPHLNGIDPSSLLKRRWNDVVDSLNEFEIYLANDPKGIIDKLVAKSPAQNLDVSQIFRDVADTFDTTWRRKGINIEQAIVTPLKANINEAVLRRLLVGPWRSCVYFARRGNGVVFSAKSIDGVIIARWECEGMAFPEEFFQLIKNSQMGVNERIEKGMEMIALDPSSPNTLFALISFVTWIDLAEAAGANYSINQGSEGMVVELRI